MKIIHVPVFVSLILVGCTASSGVIAVDKEIYYISKRSPQVSFGPPVAQKADIYRDANEFCDKQGKAVETVDLIEVNQVFGRHGSASLTFRCVPK